MRPSDSNAAKMATKNSTLAKRFGTPHNASDCTGGRKTEASSRPAVNSSITNNKWGEAPNDYGTSGHGLRGWQGGRK